MPDGSSRFSKDGKPIYHYMGTSTFSEYTVLPEISVAKISKDAPLEKVCLLGCGVTTGIGAVMNTAKVEAGATVAIFGLGGIGLSAIIGAVMAKASRIVGVDINPAKFEIAKQLGATDCINPLDHDKPIQDVIVGSHRWRRGLLLRVHRQRQVMRSALECCHKGWGESVIIGVAGAGEDLHPALPAGHRPGVARVRPSVACAAAASCPVTSSAPSAARFRSTPSSPTHGPGRHQHAFELMHEARASAA